MANTREEPGKENDNKRELKDAWKFFSSMKMGIILLLVITAMSVYGSLLPHAEAMDRVYTSWWFVGTLVLIALNLLVCSLNRWGGIWEKATVVRDDLNYKTLQSYQNQQSLAIPGETEEKAAKIRDFLLQKGYRVGTTSRDKGFLVSGDKGRFGYFGSLVTHLSIILLLLAGLYGIVGGYEDFDGGFPGRILPVENEDFQVRIDDFYISYRDDAQKSIEQYYSELTVIENGRTVKQETIYVNKPLRYKGVNFYQSTYGWGVETNITNTATGEEENVLIIPGRTFYHNETDIHLHLIEFYPDFTMTTGGMPVSRSAYPANPFVAYRLTGAQGVIGTPFQLAAVGDRLELDDNYMLQFSGYRNYTGLLIVRNPGKSLALLASILMIAGLVMSFYFFPRRVWAYLGEETDGKVLITGQSYRNKVGFQMEFDRLISALKNKLGV